MSIDEARAHVGDRVVYHPWGERAGERREYGVITSVNEWYVFVRYDGKQASQGSYPEQLALAIQDASR